MTGQEQVAGDLEWLAAFRADHDDVAVMAKAQRPYAYFLRDGRTVHADDLHGLRIKLDMIARACCQERRDA